MQYAGEYGGQGAIDAKTFQHMKQLDKINNVWWKPHSMLETRPKWRTSSQPLFINTRSNEFCLDSKVLPKFWRPGQLDTGNSGTPSPPLSPPFSDAGSESTVSRSDISSRSDDSKWNMSEEQLHKWKNRSNLLSPLPPRRRASLPARPTWVSERSELKKESVHELLSKLEQKEKNERGKHPTSRKWQKSLAEDVVRCHTALSRESHLGHSYCPSVFKRRFSDMRDDRMMLTHPFRSDT